MGVEHVLVTPVEIENGSRPAARRPPLWRRGRPTPCGRRAAARRRPRAGYAYSNGTEDVPFLSTGACAAINPEPGLAIVAAEKGWPVVRFRPRGRAGLRQVVRTAAGAAGMIGGFAAGLALGAVNGSRRDGVDLGISLAGELGTALAGVRLDVRGAEHLESARPAVFLFNHQSQLDVLILAKLLRGGFAGVAKKEAANAPGFGPMFRLADVAFVDRGNTTQAEGRARARGQRCAAAALFLASVGVLHRGRERGLRLRGVAAVDERDVGEAEHRPERRGVGRLLFATPVNPPRSSFARMSTSSWLWWLKRNTAGRADSRCSAPRTSSRTPASAVPSSPASEMPKSTPSRREPFTAPSARPAANPPIIPAAPAAVRTTCRSPARPRGRKRTTGQPFSAATIASPARG